MNILKFLLWTNQMSDFGLLVSDQVLLNYRTIRISIIRPVNKEKYRTMGLSDIWILKNYRVGYPAMPIFPPPPSC